MTLAARTLDPLTLPLQGRALIEASAGTGKTFTIALLYVRLVLGENPVEGRDQVPGERLAAGLEPPDLLVVTFTEAATRELRDRIRVRLTQAAEVFSDTTDDPNPPAETKLLYQLRDSAWPDPDTWPECRRKLLAGAEWMDEAAVSTIHAWCHRMLREHAFDSGNLFELSLEKDQDDLLDSVVRDYWRTFVYPLGPDVMGEILGRWKTPVDLRKSLKYLLPAAAEVEAGQAPTDAAAEVAERRRAEAARLKAYPWAEWRGEVVEFLNEAQKEKRVHPRSANTMRAAWDVLVDWSQSEDLLPEGTENAGLKNQQPHKLTDIVKGETPDHPAFHAIEEILTFANNQPTAHADILRHACHWVAARLEQEKQQRALMGFNDLLIRLDSALHGPRGDALAARIRQQFPAALIDEFQDTDPIQYRIFNRVYQGAANGQCLLMIGDPKQAIYGFRGADIHTYLQARRQVADRAWTLGTNFRSSTSMVNAVNQLFARADNQCADGAFLFGQGDTSPVPFHPVAAQGTRETWEVQGSAPAHLTFWTLDATEVTQKGKTKFPPKVSSQPAMAEACASEITRLLTLGQAGQAGFRDPEQVNSLRAVQPQDIAILVNTGKEAVVVRQALQRHNLKSVYLSDRESVLMAQEAQEILTWLRAFAEPHRLALTRAALATPSLGLTWTELDQLLTDEVILEKEIERFMGYHQLWRSRGVLPALRQFLMDFAVPARLLAEPDGERRLTDVLHLAELLQQESLRLDGEHALVHHFTQMLRVAEEEDEHRTLRLESDASLIKVITIHKAKGLEFPLVFLPFGTAVRQVDPKQDTVKRQDDTGRPVTVFEPTPADVAAADRERLGEDLRKLYVGLTRARYATWVGATAGDGWWASSLGYLIGGEPGSGDISPALQARLSGVPEVAVSALPETTDARYQPPPAPPLGAALTPQRSVREEWWIASYSAIAYQALADPVAGLASAPTPDLPLDDAETQNLLEEKTLAATDRVEDGPVEGWHAFPKGAGPGTFLHDLLEWCATQGFAAVLADEQRLNAEIDRRCTHRGWAEWIPVLTAWIRALLGTPLSLPRSEDAASAEAERIALADLDQPRPELEFWFASANVPVTRLDQSVQAHILPGVARPAVQDNRFNGLLKGFIDLVFVHRGKYYVLDYKSNSLGTDDSAYTPEAMARAVADNRYDLQYVLYVLALHRLLKARLPGYDYDTHVGGAVYLFLRGIQADSAGAYADRPPRALIEQLDALFAGVDSEEALA